jgi:Lsr2
MAKKTEVVATFTDDLDGGKAEGSVRFAYRGTTYEIDLSKRNRAAMEKTFAPYIAAGRKVTPARRSTTRARPTGSSKSDLAAIREWANANGYTVSDRGRIAADVQAAYHAAR